jgi:hypothetical protein
MKPGVDWYTQNVKMLSAAGLDLLDFFCMGLYETFEKKIYFLRTVNKMG